MTTRDLDKEPNRRNQSAVLGALRSVGDYWRLFWRRVAYMLPRGLYARSLLIVILPMILLQAVVAGVFMERHWQTVTRRLSMATARDISALVDLVKDEPPDGDYSDIVTLARDRLDLTMDVLPPGPLPPPRPQSIFSILDWILPNELKDRISEPIWVNTYDNSKIIEIRIKLPNHTVRVFTPRNQAAVSNTHIFLVWMIGTSVVLLTIAIPFLRNQVRPISALAEAAESFGKGRPSPPEFRPRGAEEVRRAGLAFIQMRARIERQMEQRTAMLAGVSHDLRTILTRFKLQLAMIGSKADREALNQDIDDMQTMLDGYLQFARGEAGEDTGEFDLLAYLDRLAEEAALRGKRLTRQLEGNRVAEVRTQAFTRLLDNLIGNAFRYASAVNVQIEHAGGLLEVVIDDNGPGIPAEMREEVFKPFVRLEGGRNLDSSGTGLGLAIALDIARTHGGKITLDDSPMGGLRATVVVPA